MSLFARERGDGRLVYSRAPPGFYVPTVAEVVRPGSRGPCCPYGMVLDRNSGQCVALETRGGRLIPVQPQPAPRGLPVVADVDVLPAPPTVDEVIHPRLRGPCCPYGMVLDINTGLCVALETREGERFPVEPEIPAPDLPTAAVIDLPLPPLLPMEPFELPPPPPPPIEEEVVSERTVMLESPPPSPPPSPPLPTRRAPYRVSVPRQPTTAIAAAPSPTLLSALERQMAIRRRAVEGEDEPTGEEEWLSR